MDAPRTFRQFVIGIFSEPDGTPSASRVLSFLATLVWLLIEAATFVRTGQAPSGSELLGGGVGASAPYLANKLAAVVKR